MKHARPSRLLIAVKLAIKARMSRTPGALSEVWTLCTSAETSTSSRVLGRGVVFNGHNFNFGVLPWVKPWVIPSSS